MTVVTCSDLGNIQLQDEVGLNDQDIEHLLFEADERLKPSSNTKADSVSTSGLDTTSLNIHKLAPGRSFQPYVRREDDFAVVDTTRVAVTLSISNYVLPMTENGMDQELIYIKDRSTAGSAWFDLPKTELTAELKRDLQLLRMRSVLDPKRHYKKDGGKARPPPYSQVGTIIEGPTEFFSSRIAKKDRTKTFVEEALARERENKRFESKYRGIQGLKQSGKQSFYNNLRAKRRTLGK
ncbi:nucleolus protein required for cell viability [Aspergillus ellipticus CBS 707.79]|uniref:Nucleolus protein required for cell viability n=1 Tax=Aspergillus ellipticus CBS 707.79 TaxID=1448320 RepID=A0A319DND2_9EURO|nr:nucleolus protein required for cell viability [Aspergillus ellipticus CBS 707.79]